MAAAASLELTVWNECEKTKWFLKVNFLLLSYCKTKLYPHQSLPTSRFTVLILSTNEWHVKFFFFSRSSRENTKNAATRKTPFFFFFKVESWQEMRGDWKVPKIHAQRASIALTGAIKACCDGVQKGVLWGQEALHHRHLDPGVGWPTAGWRLHHPRGTAGGFQGVSAGAGGDFEGDSPVPVAGTHIYSHPSPSDAACGLGRLK